MATQQEVADHIDLSSRQVRTLVKSGILPAGAGTGGLSLDDCRVAYIRYMRGKATGRVVSDAAELDAQKERARLTHHQANIAALEEKELEGELVRRSDVVEEVSESIANCRAKLLSLPSKMAHIVVGVESVNDVRDALQGSVHDALDELHNQYVDNGDGGEGLEGPAEADS